MTRVGILALQGAVQKHYEALKSASHSISMSVDSVLVRYPEELENLDALIMPGGESTTISKLLQKTGIDVALKDQLGKGLPIFATCAGLILLAREITGGTDDQYQFGALDVCVSRNAYGPQAESFTAELDISALSNSSKENISENISQDISQDLFLGVFIRSPVIETCGEDVEVLVTHNENPVLCKQDNILAACFHPELTEDTRIHKFFLSSIKS